MKVAAKFRFVSFLLLVLFFWPGTGDCQSPFVKQDHSIVFVENKGQVTDQDGRLRPDILYSGTAGPLFFHLSKSGISYQLVKTVSTKPEAGSVPRPQQPATGGWESTIYRVYMEWLNTNSTVQVEALQQLPGLQHFYGTAAENAITDVPSFSRLNYSGIYTGVDLNYYSSAGTLKYDFVVAPFASYKQISIKVHGAELAVQHDGSLLLKTPLGDIIEGAPVVHQDGKRIPARWNVTGETIGFVIGDYDESRQLIIDPPTRAWSTYFGTSGREEFRDCTTDESGNVYMCGFGYPSLSLATSGAHQTTYSGSTGIITKFDPDGNRIWCTYYGSTGSSLSGINFQRMKGDHKGNIYVGAWVGSVSNATSLVTSGCHQSTPGGNFDCLFIKFNTSGSRQWATFFGGGADDRVAGCTTDTSGNVYFSGTTYGSSASSTVMSTPGAFQTYGANAAFLVKFNPAGVRQWGTFYGGCDWTGGGQCATDMSGNVFMVGNATFTSTPGCSVSIATPGAFQTAHSNTTTTEAYIVKFAPNGSRIWGTLFGSTGDEGFGEAVTDAAGNVYVLGITSSTSNIASAGAHQTNFGGGQFSLLYPIGGMGDALLAKFSPSGARIWSTYYGGQREEYGTGIAIDSLNSIYITGLTSTYNGSVFVSPGAFQPAYAGAEADYYLAKFDSNGVRQWGTYYGTQYLDRFFYLGLAYHGGLYLCGTVEYTSSAFGTPGSYQPMGAGDYDGFLSKFESCSISTLAAVGFPAQTCPGQSFTVTPSGSYAYTVSPGSYTALPAVIVFTAATVYTLTGAVPGCTNNSTRTYTVNGGAPLVVASGGAICPGESFTINPSGAVTYSYSSGTNVVTPSATTTYSVWGASSASCVSNPVTVTVVVNALPVVSFSSNNTAICYGNSYIISPSGAPTFSYSSGSNVVTPGATTTYTVWGISQEGCVSGPATINVLVNPLPVISLPDSAAICTGDSYTINPSGAVSYTFSSGNNVVSPIATTTYSVWGMSQHGCSSNVATVTVIVNVSPLVSVSGSTSNICEGDAATLTAVGAQTYTWLNGPSGESYIVNPAFTTMYIVYGSQNGCTSQAYFILNVVNCDETGTGDLSGSRFRIYPNPSNGNFIVELEKEDTFTLDIINIHGQLIMRRTVNGEISVLSLEGYSRGLYFFTLRNSTGSYTGKLFLD